MIGLLTRLALLLSGLLLALLARQSEVLFSYLGFPPCTLKAPRNVAAQNSLFLALSLSGFIRSIATYRITSKLTAKEETIL